MLLSAVRPVPHPGEGGPVRLRIDLVQAPPSVTPEEIRSVLIRHPGESPVYFRVPGADGAEAVTIRARRLLVSPSDELLQALRERLGADAVQVTGPSLERGAGGRTEAVPF
jgi:hypothetical protein